MKHAQVGDLWVASRVGERFGRLVGKMSRSTIRNWRNGDVQRVADWRQLAAVAVVLGLSALEADALLQAADTGTLAQLWTNATEDERELLAGWMAPAPVEIISDDLRAIREKLEGAGEADPERERAAYLAFLDDEYGVLRLPDGKTVELERIYVALKADAMNAAERAAENRVLLEDVERVYALGDAAGTDDAYVRVAALARAVTRNPYMVMLEARNWEMLFGARDKTTLSLAEVVQRHPYVVILGDPGAGKTTLCRWLALQLAHAWAAGAERVVVAADRVRPGDDPQTDIDLGAARLPLLVRVGDYAAARFGAEADNDLTLTQFLVRGGQYSAEKLHNHSLTPQGIGALARHVLAAGRAMVVLDGLDEVGDPTQRQRVMEAVDQFVQAQSHRARDREHAGIEFEPGNRVLLTSRIVGYQFRPLTHLPHYTVEEMDETAIGAFARAWLQHVAGAADLDAETERLRRAIFEAHAGVRVLAGNPLLATILAQVYWRRTEQGLPARDLPARRVDLFVEAERAFYEQRHAYWRDAAVGPEDLSRALGAVAAHLQAHEVTGFVTERTAKHILRAVLPDERQIKAVLEAGREVAGFLVARGEGVYGFVHRGLQEYFAARHLVDSADDLGAALQGLALDPTWREPLALAVGLASEEPQESEAAFRAILQADDPAGAYLPRRELLAVAACAECVRVPAAAATAIGERLLSLYAQRTGRGKSPVLRGRIEGAFGALQQTRARRGGTGAM